jgi:hypothetical protein
MCFTKRIFLIRFISKGAKLKQKKVATSESTQSSDFAVWRILDAQVTSDLSGNFLEVRALLDAWLAKLTEDQHVKYVVFELRSEPGNFY